MIKTIKRSTEGTHHGENRRGVIIVLAAVLLVVLLGFVALSVDVGNIELTRTQLQTAADAAALSGAMELSGTDPADVVRANARAAVVSIAAMHRNGDRASVTIDPINDITFGKVVWNSQTQTYQYFWGEDQSPYSVIKVRAMRTAGGSGDNRLPLFFAPALGSSKADVGAEAIASFHPRDIMMVLDFSASMNDDSCFGRIGTLGRTYIESNMLTMWQQLGSPVYGNLTFTPTYATLRGRAASGTIPHIDVTYKRTSVTVTSTLGITQIRFQYSDSSTQTISVSGSPLTGTYNASSGKTISTCWVKSGTNASLSSGNYGEQFSFTNANIKTALGLTGTYPYASGSWDEFITENQSTNNGIYSAGYRDKYGYMTWMEYLQTKRYSAAETADLWKTSEQPVGSMKDAACSFLDFLQANSAQDQVGLAIYTHTNSTGAILEHGLSTNVAQVRTTLTQRQAGHYTPMTNISAGMKTARDEINAHARLRTFRLMVLMTDGIANQPGSDTQARAAVVTEAYNAAAAKIKILTISLGVGADTALMQQIADITGGVHFNCPGGSSISALQAQLNDTFKLIANSRPLKLVSGH